MQKEIFSFRRIVTMSFVVVLMAGLLAACSKNTGGSTQVPAAGLMVFNLAPDKEPIGVALSGNPVTNAPLSFTAFNGAYQNIYAGARDVEAFDYVADSVFTKSNFNFENNNFYSVFVVGNNGVYQNVTVKDEIDSSASLDKAYIRYINAIPDSSSPGVTIAAGGSNVTEGPAAFAAVSPFTAVDPGDISIAVSNGGSISANRTIAVEKGNIYTALLVGVPGQTDSIKKVQIRYVVNGTVPAPTSDK